jgi:hypothetical protein
VVMEEEDDERQYEIYMAKQTRYWMSDSLAYKEQRMTTSVPDSFCYPHRGSSKSSTKGHSMQQNPTEKRSD